MQHVTAPKNVQITKQVKRLRTPMTYMFSTDLNVNRLLWLVKLEHQSAVVRTKDKVA